jgi:hypothetical protein
LPSAILTTLLLAPHVISPSWDGLPDRALPPLFGAFFAFLVNSAVIESDVAEAAPLSRFVREQFSVDARAREFVVCDSGIERSAIASLQSLLSGSAISVGRPEVFQSYQIGNWPLECNFLFCWKAGIATTLSVSVIQKRVDFMSTDFGNLSFEALDDLFLSPSVMIESEDELLRFFVDF